MTVRPIHAQQRIATPSGQPTRELVQVLQEIVEKLRELEQRIEALEP